MLENYGEIKIFSGNYAPRGWAMCDGSMLNPAQYQMLFFVLDTRYGGDGTKTFGLPDLRGRIPLHRTDPLKPPAVPINITDKLGAETTQFTAANLPAHTHTLVATPALGQSNTPAGMLMASTAATVYAKDNGAIAKAAMNSNSISSTGAGPDTQTISIVQPYLAINYIIYIGDQS